MNEFDRANRNEFHATAAASQGSRGGLSGPSEADLAYAKAAIQAAIDALPAEVDATVKEVIARPRRKPLSPTFEARYRATMDDVAIRWGGALASLESPRDEFAACDALCALSVSGGDPQALGSRAARFAAASRWLSCA